MNAVDKATGEVVDVLALDEWGTKGEGNQLAALFSALSTAQAEIGAAKKGATNPHLRNKYADLGSYIEASSEALQKNGLSVVQLPLKDRVMTILGHKEGGMIYGSTPIILGEGKGLNPAQVYGSACSYARRYGRSAILDMAAEDDDAAGAGANRPPAQSKPPAAARQAPPPPARAAVTDETRKNAIKEIREKLVAAKREETGLCGWLGVETLEKATNALLDKALAALDAPIKAAPAKAAAAAPAQQAPAQQAPAKTEAAPAAKESAAPTVVPTTDANRGDALQQVRDLLKTSGREEVALCGWLGVDTLEKASNTQVDKALAALTAPQQRAAA